jgi:hypothetical protein
MEPIIPDLPGLPSTFRNLKVTQVGILVPDLVSAVQTYGPMFGIDDWLIYSYSPETVPVLSYRQAPGKCSFRLAMGSSGPQIEVIQPGAGPSVYHEWIEQHGYGVQHLGMHVPDLAVVRDSLEAEGWLPVQAGSGYGVAGDGAFAYYDTVELLGFMLEVIELPAKRRPSEPLVLNR